MTPVLLPWAEGILCHCGALWNTPEIADRCTHGPGAGRSTPLPGERLRVLRILYGDIATAAGMVAMFAAAVFLLYALPLLLA